LTITEKPLDILAQQMVALGERRFVADKPEAEAGGIGEEALFRLMRRAYPYRASPREFERVLEMLSKVSVAPRPEEAHIHRDRVHGLLRAAARV
jgi:ATP-dependent Lhr-like helicase